MQFLTVLYGADVESTVAERVVNTLTEQLGDRVEINLIEGGQPVYYFIISAE